MKTVLYALFALNAIAMLVMLTLKVFGLYVNGEALRISVSMLLIGLLALPLWDLCESMWEARR